MSETDLLQSTVFEYQGLLASVSSDGNEELDTNFLIRKLSGSHDWTEDGARAIVMLANEYGAFVLRNALALAIAQRKEDGSLGF